MQTYIIDDYFGCKIQHDSLNNRIYVMDWSAKEGSKVLAELDKLAEEKGYTKIFAKIPGVYFPVFAESEYSVEAKIPRYYDGRNDCLFLAKYFSLDRSEFSDSEKVGTVLQCAEEKTNSEVICSLGDISLKKAEEKDAEELSRLYKIVFPSYPFPITDPDYILKTMRTHIDYYIVREGEDIVSASSAEKDYGAKTCEMTDFATFPAFRNKGLASLLLKSMEENIQREGFKCSYTIARALSFGMNITFAKSGYHFAGTLINNTHISGAIESMNVWYKHFSHG